MRSRDLFDDAIQRSGLDAPRIGYESFETKVLCHYGRLNLGIPVLPSDIARAFARTGEFGSYGRKLLDHDTTLMDELTGHYPPPPPDEFG